jgi:hypothetical protein
MSDFKFNVGDRVKFKEAVSLNLPYLPEQYCNLIVNDRYEDYQGNWYHVTGNRTDPLTGVLMNIVETLHENQLEFAGDQKQTLTSNLYCSCSYPDKRHNIGIGTLDFWVCKRCKKEIKT